MSALNLLHLFDSVFLIAMAGWVGSLLVLGFAVRPVAEHCLEAEDASAFERALAARLYVWGAVCGAIALPALICGPLAVPELRGPAIGIQAMVVLAGILATLYCGNVLVPALDAAATNPAAARPLRIRMATLGNLVLIAALGLLVAHAYREPPRSSGIIEATPQEHYRESLRQTLGPEASSEAPRDAPSTAPIAPVPRAASKP